MQFETNKELDAWLNKKIETELSQKPDPDWGGVMEIFFDSARCFPLPISDAEKMFKEAVEYGDYINEGETK